MPMLARFAVLAILAGLFAAPATPVLAEEYKTLELIKKRIKDAVDDVVTGKVFEEAIQQVREAQRKHALKAAGYNKKLPYYVPDGKAPEKPRIAPSEDTSPKPRSTAKPRKKPVLASEQVRAEQKALNELGFDAGKPDGIFGSRTAKAVKRYQELIYHPKTGKLTAEERKMLFEAARKKRQLAAVRKKEPGRGTLSYTVVNKSPSGLPPSPLATPRADRQLQTGTTIVQKRSTKAAATSPSLPSANAGDAKSQLPSYEEENPFDVDDPED